MKQPRAFLTGGDNRGWALDMVLATNRRALEGIVEFADLESCDVVHSIWWEAVARLPESALDGKRVVSYVPGEPFRFLADPRNPLAMRRVGKWVVGTTEALRQFRSIGVEGFHVPFLVDVDLAFPIPKGDARLEAAWKRWRIPRDRYLIGSFQRDTEGADLRRPKLIKGPDILAEMVRPLHRRGYPVHVVLAGPRRNWLRQRLAADGVPFTFVGEEIAGDDHPANILPRDELNLLYNLVDLYVVSSRSEGGPNTTQEAVACRCKTISTRVGMAEDLLEPGCVYDTAPQAVDIIAADIERGALDATVEPQYRRVLEKQTPEAARPLFRQLYERIGDVPVFRASPRVFVAPASPSSGLLARVARKAARSAPAILRHRLTVSIWHNFRKPPWGGGNQFMLTLREGLRKSGVRVIENRFESADVHLLQAIWFDIDKFRAGTDRYQVPVVHRVAGPIQLARGFDAEKDEQCLKLNSRYAGATVFQSAWSLQRYVDLGYRLADPVIIPNAADPAVFHARGRRAFAAGGKVRLVSMGWSDNPRKGGDIYKWLEEHLDWDRFEYTFVGHSSETFGRATHVPPVGSAELADILRQHDVFVFASLIEAGSNAIVEAMSCGLPVLYRNSSSNPEVVGHGGLPFHGTQDLLEQLDRLVEDHETFQRLLTPPSLDDVAETYRRVLAEVAESR